MADVKRGLPGGHNRGFQDVQILNVEYIKRIPQLFVSLYLVSRGRVGGGVYREGCGGVMGREGRNVGEDSRVRSGSTLVLFIFNLHIIQYVSISYREQVLMKKMFLDQNSYFL